MSKQYLEITTAIGCPNNCVFCPQKKIIDAYRRNDLGNSNRTMTFQNFKQIVNKVPKSVTLVFSGMCEPFKNPDCTEMTLYAFHKGFFIHIYTTLMGLSSENAQKIFHALPFNGKDHAFSIHLPSKEKLEHIIVDDGYFRTLTHILQTKRSVELHYHGEKLHPRVAKFLAVYPEIVIRRIPIMDRAGNVQMEGVKKTHYKRGYISCPGMGNVVMPNGTVVLCCMDYAMNYVLGNLLESDYKNIEKSAVCNLVERSYWDESLDTICRHCALAKDMNMREAFNIPSINHRASAIVKILINNCKKL